MPRRQRGGWIGRRLRGRLAALKTALWVTVVALPLAGLAVLLAKPGLDRLWEHHPAHFWLVLAVGAVCVALGLATGEAARKRDDARIFLVSLAFLTSAGFLGLHALATPGVLLEGKNVGFVIATPIGLLLAACLAAAHPAWPQFRVGVNTGPAVVGNVGASDQRSFSAIGDTTNVAARLEAAADPGSVVIGASTYAPIREHAQVEPLAPLALKGKREPVEAFVLVGFANDSRYAPPTARDDEER